MKEHNMNESDMIPSTQMSTTHAESILSLEKRQYELSNAINDIKELLRKIDTSISGDAPRGVAGVVTRLAKLEEEVSVLKRGDYVGSAAYNLTVSRVDAQGRVIEAIQKSIEAHQVVITEYVNSKNRVEGATWATGRIFAGVWAFVGAGGLFVLMKLFSAIAPIFGAK